MNGLPYDQLPPEDPTDRLILTLSAAIYELIDIDVRGEFDFQPATGRSLSLHLIQERIADSLELLDPGSSRQRRDHRDWYREQAIRDSSWGKRLLDAAPACIDENCERYGDHNRA